MSNLGLCSKDRLVVDLRTVSFVTDTLIGICRDECGDVVDGDGDNEIEMLVDSTGDQSEVRIYGFRT